MRAIKIIAHTVMEEIKILLLYKLRFGKINLDTLRETSARQQIIVLSFPEY